jgi:hypothetical protein
LNALHHDHTFRVHAGVHDYRNTESDIRDWADRLVADVFGRFDPATFDLRNADPSFGAYGWTFIADPNRAPEFLDVTDARPTGVTLTGSGTTSVITAPLFQPGEMVVLRIDGVEHFPHADPQGRLHFVVDLGPPHRAQQFSVEALLANEQPTTSVVRFASA